MKLRCERIIVTGGSRGIGYHIARKLAKFGARVVITGRNIKTLQKAAETIGTIPLEWDLLDVSKYRENFKRAEELLGGLDGLVNNAGIIGKNESGWAGIGQSEEEWDAVMGTDLKAVFFMMKSFCTILMERNQPGNICNIASELGIRPGGTGAYAAAKAGVVFLTKGFARILAVKGIVINGIAPGDTATEMINTAIVESWKRQPIGRIARPEEIADLAVFLLSKEGENIIGQTVISDGGASLCIMAPEFKS
jgi:NAD(P)-dependent dehydrogenase (short-subunit alcohol dehydrogenase family)